MPKKRTHEQFIEEMKIKHPNIEVISKYTKSNELVLLKCKIDNNIWKNTPSHLLNGQGCPKCSNKRRTSKMRKTHEQFLKEMNTINNNIEFLSEYITSQTNIKCRCKIDGHIWETTPSHLLNGTKCPKCTNHITMTQEDFIESMKINNPNQEVIGTYINTKTPVKVRCKIHNKIWETRADVLLKGAVCPICNSENISKRMTGENNPSWNPNLTDEDRQDRNYIDGYKEWRTSVYKRDNYTCQICGSNNNLNAHHIDGYKWCIEKRLDINNGITLCKDCHTKFHKNYGYKHNTKEQYMTFKSIEMAQREAFGLKKYKPQD